MTGGYHAVEGPRLRRRASRAPSPPEQRERYSRHFLLPEIGPEGQQKLLDAKVLLLGAGGLGSPTALYLAAAGVGTLGIVDDDVVDVSNLQRQVIHTTDRVGVPKVDSAEQAIKALNPDVEVVKYHDAPRRLEHHGDHRGLRRRRRRRRQLPDALPAQRRLRAPADPGRQRGDPRLRGPAHRSSSPTTARATAASSASRRRPSWRRPAAPTASSACCPARWGSCRRPRSSSSSSGVGEPAHRPPADLRRARRPTTELKVRRDPECPICSRAPEEIADEEMGVFPDYEAFCAAAG